MTDAQSGRGLAVVISGPSGAGKSTVVAELAKRYGYRVSVSATTRAPRPGERDGEAYRFWSRERFRRAAGAGELLESSEHFDNLYGTPAGPVLEAIEKGETILLEIDVKGAEQVMERLSEAYCIFLAAPDREEMERRLRNRHSETEAAVRTRLQRADMEMAQRIRYNERVVNDDLDTAVERIHGLIQAREEKKV